MRLFQGTSVKIQILVDVHAIDEFHYQAELS
jgi:hypothetical protein